MPEQSRHQVAHHSKQNGPTSKQRAIRVNETCTPAAYQRRHEMQRIDVVNGCHLIGQHCHLRRAPQRTLHRAAAPKTLLLAGQEPQNDWVANICKHQMSSTFNFSGPCFDGQQIGNRKAMQAM
jgi:hypothetical protein